MKPSDLAETLKVLKEYDLLDRLGYVSDGEIKLFAPGNTVGVRDPIEEHKALQRREAQQMAWEKGVRTGQVGRWVEPPQANGDAVPSEVKQAIRQERAKVRTEGA